MKAVVLAAGKGTRLYPLTIDIPKILLPVLGRPLIEWFLEMLKSNSDEIIFVIADNDYSKQIEDYIVHKSETWLAKYPKISFVYQHEQLGTSDALMAAKEYFDKTEKFLLLYGDDLYSQADIERLLEYEFGVVGMQVNDPEKWGILQASTEGKLEKIIEKPDTFVGNIANIGMYLVDSDIFELHEHIKISIRGEYELTDTISLFAQQKPMHILAVGNYWLPLGYPWMILNAQEKLIKDFGFSIKELETDENVLLNPSNLNSNQQKLNNLGIIIEHNVQIRGNLLVSRNTVIKSGSYFEGDVIVAEACEIGPNAYLRGITTLGKGVKIGMSEVKNSIIMDDSHLPHFNYFGDGLMGKGVNFAAGCVAANLRFDEDNVKTMIKDKLVDTGRRKFSTVIGNNAKFGTGVSIYPGRKIWPDLNINPGEIISVDINN